MAGEEMSTGLGVIKIGAEQHRNKTAATDTAQRPLNKLGRQFVWRVGDDGIGTVMNGAFEKICGVAKRMRLNIG